jgi:hypothetical protein
MFEEVVGSLQWFNPGAWLLLAQARLAREQFVDQEAVRLTASREPYIEALLSFAKDGYSDLVPAPSFLRRNHLTQRMHFLLQEPSMSASRLVASYASIAVLLGATFWITAGSMPLVGQPQTVNSGGGPGPGAGVSAPRIVAQAPAVARRIRVNASPEAKTSIAVPTFAQDPVNVTPVPVVTPEDRAAAIAFLETAKQAAKLHMPNTPSWEFNIPFRAYADPNSRMKYLGDGELTETWRNGQSWRWTAKIGDYAIAQYGSGGMSVNTGGVNFMPHRAQTLRSEIFWAVDPTPSSARIRAAAVQWNGKTLSCLLFAPGVGEITGPRSWDEEEFCIEPSKKTLEIHSHVPGSYTYFSYDLGHTLGGHAEPDAIQLFEGGTLVLEARVDLHDLRGVEASALAPPSDGVSAGIRFSRPARMRLNISGQTEGRAIVHASLDSAGLVMEADLSSATNDEAARAALELIAHGRFGVVRNVEQTQAFLDIQFLKQ